MTQTTEKAFETHVEEILLGSSGWKSGANAEWDKERALFLPFNRGSHPGEIQCGAGNPQHPSGYRTGYFWDEVLQRDSFLDILGHFMFMIASSSLRTAAFSIGSCRMPSIRSNMRKAW